MSVSSRGATRALRTVVLAGSCIGGCSRDVPSDVDLILNQELTIAGEAHEIRLTLHAGDAYLVSAMQHGIDVRLAVVGPDATAAAASDLQNQLRAPESVLLEVAEGGLYRIAIHPVTRTASGDVTLRVERLAIDTRVDRERIRAEKQVAAVLTPTTTWDAVYWQPRIDDLARARTSLCGMRLIERCAWTTWLEAWLRYKYLEQWRPARALALEATRYFSPQQRPAEYAAALTTYSLALIESDKGDEVRQVSARRDRADRHFEQAVALLRSVGALADAAWSQNGHATSLYYQGRQKEAERAFLDAQTLALDAGADELALLIRKNLAVISRSERFEEALDVLESIAGLIDPTIDPEFFGITQLQLGERYLEHARWRDAISALALAEQHLTARSDITRVLAGLTRAFFEAGQYERARTYLAEAITRGGDINEAPTRLRLYQTGAELAAATGSPADGIDQLKQALSLAANPRDRGMLGTSLARLHRQAGNHADAIRVAEAAEAALRVGNDVPEIAKSLLIAIAARIAQASPDDLDAAARQLVRLEHLLAGVRLPLVRAEMFALRARQAALLDDLPAALQSSRIAIGILSELRFSEDSPTYGAGQLRSASDIYLQHADLLLANEHAEQRAGYPELFDFVDALKGARLYNSLSAARGETAASPAAIGISELTRSAALSPESHSDTPAAASRLERAHLQRDLHVRAHAGTNAQELPRLESLQSMLPRGTALLQYWLKGRTALVWMVTRDRVDVVPLGSPEAIRAIVTPLYEALSQGGPAVEQLRQQLAPMILPPGILPEMTQELLVVPDAELHALPLDLVLDLDHPVIRLHAASLLATGPSGFTKPESITLFGNPEYREGLGGLSGSASEVEFIADQLEWSEAEVWTGREATRSRFLRVAGSRDVLHVAAHGVFDLDNPLLSGIAFSDVSEPAAFLTLADLWQLDLSGTRLVVLSGCKTAFGEKTSFEGLAGFPASIVAAGADRVLVSLWDVPDQSTSALMQHFYSGMMREGLDPARALRNAQAEVRRNAKWRHPRHWGAWILVSRSR